MTVIREPEWLTKPPNPSQRTRGFIVVEQGEQHKHKCKLPGRRSRKRLKLGKGAVVQCYECRVAYYLGQSVWGFMCWWKV